MSTPARLALALENVPQLLKEKPGAKEEFFDRFWSVWSANGFGTLTKKDTELLIFCCLKQAFGTSGPQNNYGWARLLRVTPSRIKAMRLEAHLRFGHHFGESGSGDLNTFLEHFTKLHSIALNGLASTGDISDVTVSFIIEDPVVQMEVEHRLKLVGSYLDFHRNREVVSMSLTSFFLIFADEKQQAAINGWVAEKAKETADADGLKKRVLAKEFANQSEGEKAMTFVDDLAETAQVKTLSNLLKKVFASQKERPK